MASRLLVRNAIVVAGVAIALGLTSCTQSADDPADSSATAATSSSDCENPQGQETATTDAGKKAVEIARASMESNGLSSVLIRVGNGDDVIASAAMGDSMTNVPANLDMHFHNGAIAYTYLSTVLLQLVEEGKASLDDPVGKWVPDVPEADTVTLRMLAASTTGYPDYETTEAFNKQLDKDPFHYFTPEELLKAAFAQPMLYKPGTNWSYAHTNFFVLAQALEKMTGQSLADLISERVIERADLAQTASQDTPIIPNPVLHQYTTERKVFEDSTYWGLSWTGPPGVVMTTNICDVLVSARAIGRGDLVSEESHKEQIAPPPGGSFGGPTAECPKGVCVQWTDKAYYGLGTFVINGWILQNPVFNGMGVIQAYLPSEDISIAIAAAGGQASDPLTNYASQIFGQVGAELAPQNAPPPS
jgi:D-alanyl-D-alanine carboxypeptidase